ncbi:bifunctional DNA-formamidopyrimidine glycosylase/DNA-(apurinic or apyrimidinic site) lyase [Paenibacillus sp. SYP-B3998]|uniref:Formamidopyrimidine-DNA glycosylase n=1 Tax=Paenibacillus sp. SYP-B3998 TaxID=2678564 RepID=A0A6G3ZWQ8_9BACL|nr:bifunctional DNA-formamidopyrimidine glycosylase/DNA-(apurinic or apyrimidinic site) lyase [Paenibacillus sp. SYP-B3998]NEW06478.1 bifunctional DNA-formamidopyrimidine glycosylase/DNA-(apurinic or apyrimidinic site) lyase [Paenibacillus sp. SYP-B3998]
MPELPEMETYRRQLTPLIQGMAITGVEVNRPKSLNVDPEQFIQTLLGNRVVRIDRRAKHLLFLLATNEVLLLHLMLGGWMFYGTEEEKPDRTTQVVIHYGTKHLYFIGLRLGYLHLHSGSEVDALLSKLGPEPLEAHFTFARFQAECKGKKSNLKVVLIDQTIISGIGNCYSDEICFSAGLLPIRKIPSLQEEELNRLYHAMRAVLLEAIQYGGYMESPLFSGDPLTGQFDARCRVYDREGEPCLRCGHPIIKKEVSSRKCFYCANCQA